MKRFFALLLALCLLAPSALAISARDMMEQCEAYVASGEYESALACFELARLSDPDVSYDPYVMGPVWLYTGYPDYARQCAQDAVKAEPLSVRAWQLMYDVYSTLGDQEEAHKAQLYLKVLQTVEASDAAVDSALAELFERGNIRLQLQSFFGMSNTPTPYFVSPDGQTGVFIHPGDDDGIYLVPRGNAEKAVKVLPSATRGVADAAGKWEKLMRYAKLQSYFDSPAVWSPDGRYVTFNPWIPTTQTASAQVEPFVIDTHTGEWIILESNEERSIIKGGIGLIHAAFSADSSKLYYVCAYRSDGSIYSLRCADLATGDVTVLYATDVDYFPSYPALCLTETGSLLSLEVHANNRIPNGLNIFTPAGGTWQRNLQYLNLRAGEWRARFLQHSPVTDYTIINGSLALDQVSSSNAQLDSFKVFRVQDDAINQEEAALQYVIHGEEAPAMLALNAEEYAQYAQNSQRISQSNWNIGVIRMSPGGKYALVSCVKAGEHALLLVRLEDMACQSIQLPEGMTPGFLGTDVFAGIYAAGLTWSGEREIITLDSTNELALFTLE